MANPASHHLALAAIYSAPFYLLMVALGGNAEAAMEPGPGWLIPAIVIGLALPPLRQVALGLGENPGEICPDKAGGSIYLVTALGSLALFAIASLQSFLGQDNGLYMLSFWLLASAACAALLSVHARQGGLPGAASMVIAGAAAVTPVV